MKSSASRSCSRDEALSLLKKLCPKEVVDHCLTVEKAALSLASELIRRGYEVDLDFVRVAALLHDIGRSVTHGIAHGIEGAKILRRHPKFKKYSRICEVHLGAGITKEEAKELGLPPRDYLPQSLEEKLIAHADNLVAGGRVRGKEEMLEEFRARVPPSVYRRIEELANYFEQLLGKSSQM